MQIKTITCHDVYNHGASLQAYALQTYLSNRGHDVEIIDYKPDYLSRHYGLWQVSNPRYNKPIIKQLYLLAKLPSRVVALRRKRVFDSFTHNYLRLTTHKFHSNDELKSNPPQADVFVAGSDQIWNTLFPNGRDPAFYLDFAPTNVKRIAYAASFATKTVVDEYKPFVRRMLQNLDSISLRERVSLPLLASLGRNDGIAVCDPVFLLSRHEWDSLLPPKNIDDARYLLVYDSDKSDVVRTVACRIAKERGLPIYNVSAFRLSYAQKDYWCSSPLDFVCLVRNAEFVVSNSFHASAFSIIYHREFCVVNRNEAINERMLSLLEQYGLQDRLVTGTDVLPLLSSIDYYVVQRVLDDDIIRSKHFLQSSIG